MDHLLKQQVATSKLVEFGALRHVANDIGHRDNDHQENQLIVQGQGKILLALMTEDNVAQKQLADKVNLTAQSTAEFVRKLEKRRLVTRKKSTVDKRVTVVSLTALGRQEANQSLQEIPSFLQVLSDEELDQFAGLLSKINDGLYAEIGDADPTWFNKFHQLLTSHYLRQFHAGEQD